MITIYGASDDLVEVGGIEIDGRVGADEFSAYGSQVRDLNWHGDLVAVDGSAMRVMAWFGPGGTWLLGAGQVDEDKPRGRSASPRASRARSRPTASYCASTRPKARAWKTCGRPNDRRAGARRRRRGVRYGRGDGRGAERAGVHQDVAQDWRRAASGRAHNAAEAPAPAASV
jgi:hypothetical protein